MTETPYTPLDSHPEGPGLASTLPEVSSPTAPPVSIGYEGVSYTTSTSPYSFASSCDPNYDPNILTPISSVGSPAMQQQSRISRGYSPVGGSQQPTPPGSSKIGWSTAGSPMTVHPASVSGNHFNMGYVTADSKDALPETPDPFYGNFTVSAPDHIKSEPPERRMSHSFYHQPLSSAVSHGVGPAQPSYQMMHNPIPPMSNDPMSSDPMMPTHLPSAYPRCGDLGHGSGHPIYGPLGSPPRRLSPPKEVVSDRVKKRSRTGRKRPSDAGDFRSLQNRELSQVIEHLEVEPNTSKEWKCVLYAWQSTSHLKGKNQWQEIQAIHEKNGFGLKNTQALQMMLTRIKGKGIIWPEAMNKLLIECWRKDEAERINRITTMFNEARPRNALTFNAANIETKLVQLGLETMYIDPETKIRQRRRIPSSNKKRGRTNAADVESELIVIQPVNLTDEHEEELFKQIEMTRGPQALLHHGPGDDEDEDDDDDMIDEANTGIYGSTGVPDSLPGGAGAASGHRHQGERMARHTCEEMIIKTEQLLGDH